MISPHEAFSDACTTAKFVGWELLGLIQSGHPADAHIWTALCHRAEMDRNNHNFVVWNYNSEMRAFSEGDYVATLREAHAEYLRRVELRPAPEVRKARP